MELVEMTTIDRLLSEDATMAEQKVIEEDVERNPDDFDFCLKVEVCPWLKDWAKRCVAKVLNIATDDFSEGEEVCSKDIENTGDDVGFGPFRDNTGATYIIFYGFDLAETSGFEHYLRLIRSLSSLKKQLTDYYNESLAYSTESGPKIMFNLRINRKDCEPAHISYHFRYDDMDQYVYSYYNDGDESNPSLYDGLFLRTKFPEYTQDYYDRKTGKYFATYKFMEHGTLVPAGEIHIEESDFWAFYGRMSVAAYLIELIYNYSDENGKAIAEIDGHPIPLFYGANQPVRKMLSGYFNIDKDYYDNQHEDGVFIFIIASRVLRQFKDSNDHSLKHLEELINSCRGAAEPETYPEELDWDVYEDYLSWAFHNNRRDWNINVLPDLIRKIKHKDIK